MRTKTRGQGGDWLMEVKSVSRPPVSAEAWSYPARLVHLLARVRELSEVQSGCRGEAGATGANRDAKGTLVH